MTAIDASDTDLPTPAYPVPRPDSGDDPRFCFGPDYTIGKILHSYPPVRHGRDTFRIHQALFRPIYQEEDL